MDHKHEAKIAALAAKDAAESVADLIAEGADLSEYTPGVNGQVEADESWINAMGGESVARVLGVKLSDADGSLSDDYRAALAIYNRAFRDAVEHEKRERAYAWRTDGASGAVVAADMDAAIAAVVADGAWPAIDSEEESRLLADGAWLQVTSPDRSERVVRGTVP